MLDYRVAALEKSIDEIQTQEQEIHSSVSGLILSISGINKNIENLTSCTEKIFDRINVLEGEMKQREAKKQFYKSLISVYPIVITVLIIVFNMDHNKVVSVANDVTAIVNATKQLTSVLPS